LSKTKQGENVDEKGELQATRARQQLSHSLCT
jgi:hypothetical protein